MTTHVYVGPSLDAATAQAALPGAVLHPPVRHGDLMRCDAGPGDRVAIIDGGFFQSASVRHKEITALIDRGVAVYGAASMGALRAAELGPFGMVGHGVVYRLYASGRLERDDEVALAHSEDDAVPYTVALVSVRVLLHRLARRGLIGPHEKERLLAAAEAMPFTERTWSRLLAGAPVAVRDAVAGPPLTWDVKARDALSLLRRLARGAPPPAPSRLRAPVTGHVERWRRDAHPEETILVTAAQVYAEDYPDVHCEVIGRLLGRHASAEAIRSYRWPPGLPPIPALAQALRELPGIAAIRALAAEADELNSALAAQGHHLHQVRPAVVLHHCLRRWGAPDGLATLNDRGFLDLDDLAARATRFCPHLALADPPRLRLQGG